VKTELIRGLDRTFELAEGPVWDPIASRVLWVDILAGSWFEGSVQRGRIDVLAERSVGETVGAVFPAVGGDRVIAGRTGVWLDSDAARLSLREVIPAGDVESRINDCGIDPAGRLLVGTVATNGRLGHDRLVRFEADGSATELDSDLSCSNGLAWSTDGALMYSVDSIGHAVFVRSYDTLSGATGPRRTHIEFDKAIPDGACIDVENHLWVAVWGGSEVRRFDPAGQLVQTVKVPVPLVSSVAFVGPHLDQLMITTAREGMGAAELAEYPDSGAVYLCDPGVTGVETPTYKP
jgi:sugar lactone lactonase YvrE